MKCPLLMSEIRRKRDIVTYFQADCLKEECAWWDSTMRQCVMLSFVDVTTDVQVTLRAIFEKTPHEKGFVK